MSAKTNIHHIFWTKNGWNTGWAKVLRDHPYCRIEIPKNSLHLLIHASMPDIPVANGLSCKVAVEALDSWIEDGLCSMDDNLSTRCVHLMRCFRVPAPDTYEALRKQKYIADGYYNTGD